MILADKIINLRKREGWSQEELADRLGVSRQSISKWEGAQSIPDMKKILAMADLFGVSTDYLLRDELEVPDGDSPAEELPTALGTPAHKVSLEEAQAYIAARLEAGPRSALGVALCILSPILLIAISGMVEAGVCPLSENAAMAIGLIVLLLFVVAAVSIFIFNGSKLKRFEYMEQEDLDTEYGVSGLARELMDRQEPSHTRSTVLGVGLCVASSIPLFITMVLKNEVYMIYGVCFILMFVAAGVYLLIRTNTERDTYLALLEEGDYTRENKAANREVVGIFWGITIALYLGISLLTMRWELTWVVWPIAGILYGVVLEFVKKDL